MIPTRIIRSVEELKTLTGNSIVCAPYHPQHVFQVGGDGSWQEPGVEESLDSAGLWEWITGAHETHVLDDEREIWVIWDAAAKLERPLRSPDSPDWLSIVPGRSPERIPHRTRDEAVQALEYGMAHPAEELGRYNYSLWYRTKDRRDFDWAGGASQDTRPGETNWGPTEQK